MVVKNDRFTREKLIRIKDSNEADEMKRGGEFSQLLNDIISHCIDLQDEVDRLDGVCKKFIFEESDDKPYIPELYLG